MGYSFAMIRAKQRRLRRGRELHSGKTAEGAAGALPHTAKSRRTVLTVSTEIGRLHRFQFRENPNITPNNLSKGMML